MAKLRTAADVVPVLVTVALEPEERVVVGPTVTVAAVPFVPLVPFVPFVPSAPLGTVKFRTAAELVPELMTDADVPALPVVVGPTLTVAAVPFVPSAPLGTVKFKTAAEGVPVLMTDADVPASPVVVGPTWIVAVVPGAPGGPGSPCFPSGPVQKGV